jgi:hypothetical protein
MTEEFDNEFSNNPDYDLAYEKLFMPKIYEDFFNYTIGKAFAISNEQLDQIFQQLDLTNKSFLTVGSSGDQAINAVLRGCNDITIIDANIFTQYFIEYKLAFIKTFNYDAFSNLFITSGFFHWKIYSKLSHNLSPKVKQFWDTLMLDQEDEQSDNSFCSKTIKENLLFVDNRDKHSLFYFNKNEYVKLQKKLNSNKIKITFINSEFQKFPEVICKKFHFINLSNIYDYYCHNIPLFTQIVHKLFLKNLHKDGKILVYYDFNTTNNHSPIQPLSGSIITYQERERRFCGDKKKDTVWYLSRSKPTTLDTFIQK